MPKNQQPKAKDQIGFTLIELLVAITIVAVAFGVIISSSAIISKNTRDAKRKADLSTIQAALQQFFIDQSYFPASLGSSIRSSSRTYLKDVPTDPLTTSPNYLYTVIPNGCSNDPNDPTTFCTNFCLYSKLENPSTDVLNGCSPSVPYNYALSAP